MQHYDADLIRPPIRLDQVVMRGDTLSPGRKRSYRKALRTLHTLELMAVTIYRFQITKASSEMNRQLIAAMCNEMTHLQDFQVALLEYGLTPSKRRWAYWLVGFAMGFGSRLLGRRRILKTGIWVETKAVDHYGTLLDGVDWDTDIRRTVEKNRNDEQVHIARWKKLLAETDNRTG